MSQLDILVCGAGIAGSTLAYLLGRAGNRVTIVERAPEIRNEGQGVDIRGPAVEVIRRMGLEEQIRSRTTGEEGIAFVDTHDRTFATFPVDKDNLAASATSEIEIMRSDLAKLVTTAALKDPNVKVEYGTYVQNIVQDERRATVTYANGKLATFDLVLASDGQGSTTRKFIVTASDPINSLGMYVAWISLPREDSDGMICKSFNAPGRRGLIIRPKSATESSGFLCVMPKDESELLALTKKSVNEQKKVFGQIFEGAGWQASRLISAMHAADDFYLQHIAQVKLPTWHSGRCALVGDAAYGPSPISGSGTSLALLGAYILAGEIVQFNGDHEAAFRAYEQKLRPFVEKKQRLPPGAPAIANPETVWGITIFRWVVWFVALSGLQKWFGSGDRNMGFDAPDYKFD